MLEQFNGIKQLFRKVYPRRCSVLGIDINPTAVYMVELGYDQKSLSLISYASTSFDHLQKEESSATTQSLFKEFIAQEKKRRKSAITALSDQQVMNKSISLQCGLSVEELEASIIVEMQRNAPLKWSDLSWDYETLSINEVNSEQNLFFVAAKTEHIHSRMELLSFAGLKPKVIELVSHAVERAAQYVFPRIAGNLNNKTVALIQMGDSTLTLFIVQQSKMCAIREIPIALENFDKDSQSFESNLIKHIKELIEYTQSTNPLSIQHILLMGEKAVGATNLAQKIEMDLRITTVLANPLVAFFNPGLNQPEDLLLLAPALWIAVGLALRILDGNH